MRTGRRRLWRRCRRASERSARSCREAQRLHGITGVEQLISNQQHLHMLGAQQKPPGWSGSHVLVKLDFFFFLSLSFQSWVSQIDAAASHYLQPRRPVASNNMSPTSLSYSSPKFSIIAAPRCSPAHGRATVGTGSPAVTCCAQRVLCADRCAAQRPQTNQMNHLRDKIKKKRGDDFYR